MSYLNYQPQGRCQIEKANPITATLTLAFNPPSGLRNIVTGKKATVVGTDQGRSKFGKTRRILATSDYLEFDPIGKIVGTADVTILITYGKRDGNRQSGLFGIPCSSLSNRCGAHGPWEDGTIYFDFGDFSNGGRVTVSGQSFEMATWLFVSGSGGMAIYKNGVFLNSVGTNQTRGTSEDTLPFRLGTNGVGQSSDLVDYNHVLVFNSLLFDADRASIIANPWQVYKKPAKILPE